MALQIRPKNEIYSIAHAITLSGLNTPLYINEYEAAEISDGSMKVATLRKRRWQGKAPQFYKIGSNVRYDYFELVDYLKGCVRTSTANNKRVKHD